MRHKWLSKSESTRGFMLPLVLFIVLIFIILIAGLGPLVTTQTKNTYFSQNKLTASYIAEAGVKRGIRQMFDTLTPIGTHQPSDITTTPVSQTESFLSTGGINYTYTYYYISGSNTASNPERIEITGSATVNGSPATSKAWMVFNSNSIPNYTSPNLIDLITSANSHANTNCYHWDSSSHNHTKWNVINSSGTPCGSPPQLNQENIILFDNNYTSSNFRLDYNLKFTKTSNPGGIGVIYGASGTDKAYDFDAYCIKFNNARQSFSVTKYTSQGSSDGARPQELFIGKNASGTLNISSLGPEAQGITTVDGAMFQPNGKKPGNPTHTSFDGIDNLGNTIGRSSIPYSEVTALTGIDPTANTASYRITIKTTWETGITIHRQNGTTFTDNRLRHHVYLNDVELLSFIDCSDVNSSYIYGPSGPSSSVSNPQIDLERKVNPNKQIRTGLRVYEVTSCEYTNSNVSADFQTVSNIRRVIWKK